MSKVRNLTFDVLAAEAPQHNGPYLFKGNALLIDDDLPKELPYLRSMEFDALHALFKDPRYGPRVISHLLTKPEDLQRHILLNYVYAQTVEARNKAQQMQNAAQIPDAELTNRLNQVENALRSVEAQKFSLFQRPQPDSTGILKIKPSSYSGKEKESLRCWFVEIDAANITRKLSLQSQMVAFALSCLAGNARVWGYNLLLADRNVFPDYDTFKQKLSTEFEPPRTLQRAISELLDLSQGKRSLHEYIQQMRYLISCVSTESPSKSVKVAHFMRGLRSGYVRDEVYRLTPETFDEAVHYALDAEFNCRQQKADLNSNRGISTYPRHHSRPAASSGPTPMDISSITTSSRPQSTSRVSYSRTGPPVRRPAGTTCNNCGKQGHWSPECRQPRKVRSSSSLSWSAQKGG
jgi:hypothetical protein